MRRNQSSLGTQSRADSVASYRLRPGKVHSRISICQAFSAILTASVLIVLGDAAASSQDLPPNTAVPVVFTSTLRAGQTNAGEIVKAKTIQMIRLAHGKTLPVGAAVLGHVIRSTAFFFDSTPYAVQKPSILAIRFDTISVGKTEVPVDFEVRVIAGSIASHDAAIPRYLDEADAFGTRVLVGGSSFSPLESPVVAPDGEIVGYNRAGGVFARLLAAQSAKGNTQCDLSDKEQSMGIFSPEACGVYGLNTVAMTSNGAAYDHTIVLESSHQAVELDAGSTALLQATHP
jgi:hypothetical protein